MSKDILQSMWDIIPQIKTPIAFGAFAIAALTLIARSRGGRKTEPTTIVIVVAIVIIGALVLLIPGPGAVPQTKTYLVRVTTLNPGGLPIEGAKVRTTVSNEASTATDGSVTFSIPEQSLPNDHKIVVFANSGDLNGQQGSILSASANISMTLRLTRDLTASVSGLVEDDQGNPIAGAQVAMVGGNAAISDSGGQFYLNNIGALGGQIRLHTSKKGFAPDEDYYQIGSGLTIQLIRRRASR